MNCLEQKHHLCQNQALLYLEITILYHQDFVLSDILSTTEKMVDISQPKDNEVNDDANEKSEGLKDLVDSRLGINLLAE